MPKPRRPFRSSSNKSSPSKSSASSSGHPTTPAKPSKSPLKSVPRLPSKPPLAPPGTGTVKLWASLRRLWDTVLPTSRASSPSLALPCSSGSAPTSPTLPNKLHEPSASDSIQHTASFDSQSDMSSSRRSIQSPSVNKSQNSSSSASASASASASGLRVRSISTNALPTRKFDKEPTSPSSKAVPPSTTTRQFKFPTPSPSSSPRSSSLRSNHLTRSRSGPIRRNSKHDIVFSTTQLRVGDSPAKTDKDVVDIKSNDEPKKSAPLNANPSEEQAAPNNTNAEKIKMNKEGNETVVYRKSTRISNVLSSFKEQEVCSLEKKPSAQPQVFSPPPGMDRSRSPNSPHFQNQRVVKSPSLERTSRLLGTQFDKRRRQSLPSSSKSLDNQTGGNMDRLQSILPSNVNDKGKDFKKVHEIQAEIKLTDTAKKPSVDSRLKQRSMSNIPRQHLRIRENGQRAVLRLRQEKDDSHDKETDFQRREFVDDSSLYRFRSPIVREAVRASRLKSTRRLSATKMSNSMSDTESASRCESQSYSSFSSQRGNKRFSYGDKRSTNIRSKYSESNSSSSSQKEENKLSFTKLAFSIPIKAENIIEDRQNKIMENGELKLSTSLNVVCTLPASIDIPPSPKHNLSTGKESDIDHIVREPLQPRDRNGTISNGATAKRTTAGVKSGGINLKKKHTPDMFETELRESDLSPQIRPSENDIHALYNIRPASYLRHLINHPNASVGPLSAPASPRGGGLFVGFPMNSSPNSLSPFLLTSSVGADDSQKSMYEFAEEMEKSKARRASLSAVIKGHERSSWIGLRRKLHADNRIDQRLNKLQLLVTQLRSRSKQKPITLSDTGGYVEATQS